jgi:polysaccharide pyruvyl transferase WcaK-like protein
MCVGESNSPVRIVLLGATITGNRGAESMLRAAVQRIPEFVPRVRFSLLSLYPRDDKAENRDHSLHVIACSPAHLLLVAFPLALAAHLLSRVGLPHRFLLATGALRELQRADLVIDLSGISFVDGRGPAILAYNCVVVLLPRLLGKPLLKYSQALGPFRRRVNRWCAGRFLPKTAAIAARGRITEEHLGDLGLPPGKVRLCADAAFGMRIGPEARRKSDDATNNGLFRRSTVAITPSNVVHELCRKAGIAYPRCMAEFVRDYLILQRGYDVLLLPHSARPGKRSAKNNDLMICREIYRLAARPECHLLPEGVYDAETLRAMIGKCRFLVTSRFHAMVSGLAMGVPLMLVGWSHKYAEVLEAFDLEMFALDYADLSPDRLRCLFGRLEREEEEVRDRIRGVLPSVVESSLDNARLAAELLGAPSPTAATRIDQEI